MPKEKVLFRLYALLYKKPIEACMPYPIQHYLVEEGQPLDVVFDDPGKVKGYPRYQGYWRKLGSPVKQVSVVTEEGNVSTPGQPIIYLKPLPKTKSEKKATVKGATKQLAQHFVSHYLNRVWTKADNGGMVMAHAKRVLGLGYTVDQVILCLERLQRGDLTDGVPWVAYTEYHNFKTRGFSTLLCVLWGEPPALERKPSAITNLNMTPEEWTEWKKQRKAESLILDETPEATAARDFSQAPVWAKKDG